jgi:nicotinamidase/pyrazinamidase
MKALIVVDMQNDFMPGGALGVPDADRLIPTIQSLLLQFPLRIMTLDWHPYDHISFVTSHPGKHLQEIIEVAGGSQLLWPLHCVADSRGAEPVAGLEREKFDAAFYKGSDREIDSYSAFFDNAKRRSTGLADFLKSHKVQEIYFAGVAIDYCVLYSALDALELHFPHVFVIKDACAGVELKHGDIEHAFHLIQSRGGIILSSSSNMHHSLS